MMYVYREAENKEGHPSHVKTHTLNGGVEPLVPFGHKIRQFVFAKGIAIKCIMRCIDNQGRECGKMKAICFGDFNTYGYTRRYFGGRYDAGGRWVDILAMETGWMVCNMGEMAKRSPQMFPTFPQIQIIDCHAGD